MKKLIISIIIMALCVGIYADEKVQFLRGLSIGLGIGAILQTAAFVSRLVEKGKLEKELQECRKDEREKSTNIKPGESGTQKK